MEPTMQMIAICATPPGINPGMASVELALKLFLDKYKIIQDIKFFHLIHDNYNEDSGDNNILPYSEIPDAPDFFASKRMILFWGDFLHMLQYHQTIASVLYQRKYCKTFEESIRRVYNVFLFADQDHKILKRKISFGSTLLFNTLADENDSIYGPALKRFIASGNIWFRDVYSSIKASHITGNYSISNLGIDCAAFLEPTLFVGGVKKKGKRNKTGLFIGRTVVNFLDIYRFALDFAKFSSTSLSWMAWGNINAFPTLKFVQEEKTISEMENFSVEGIADPVIAVRNLTEFDVIITDTYHICVNAWNMGIPAICFYGNDHLKRRNVNSGDLFSGKDKRKVFYSMYDALDFLIHYQELRYSESRESRMNHLLDCWNDQVLLTGIHQRIRQHSKYSEEILVKAIVTLLKTT